MNDFTFNKDYFEELEIDLTGTCNLKCDRCTRNYKHSQHLVKKNVRPLSEITSQLDEFKNLKILMLAGQVSEPTLYPDFINFIKYLKSRDIKINLYTNASVENPKLFKELSKILNSKDSVHFTICGTTQELHEKYRKGSNLEIILKNAKEFISENKNDYLQYIRFTYNLSDLKTLKELFKNKIQNKFSIFSNFYVVESEGDRLFNETIQPRITMPPKDKFYKNIFSEIKKIKEPFRPNCKSIGWKKIYIDQFGKIYPCYSFAEYIKENFEIDNVYGDILRGKYFCCVLCSQKCESMMKLYDLDFVC